MRFASITIRSLLGRKRHVSRDRRKEISGQLRTGNPGAHPVVLKYPVGKGHGTRGRT